MIVHIAYVAALDELVAGGISSLNRSDRIGTSMSNMPWMVGRLSMIKSITC